MSSPQDISYWKNLAEEYKAKWQDTKEEFDEYQQSSQELENEMEIQYEQSEKKVKDLTSQNERLQTELDTLRDKFEQQSSADLRLINELQDDLAELKGYKRELEVYIRELEQMNDDLQRAKRETVSSLQDFEAKLNQAIERNAFLESELDDKDSLMESVQRLKDEARDLRQELDVSKKKKDDSDSIPSPAVVKVKPEVKVEPSTNHQQSPPNNIYKENQSHGSMSTPSRPSGLLRNGGTVNTASTPLTPTARISALNIVGDLLRKVGALETKLNAVKSTVSDQSPMTKPRNLHLAGSPSHRYRRSGDSRRGSSKSSTPQAGYVKISV